MKEFAAVAFQTAMERLLRTSDLKIFFPRGSKEDKVYEFGLEQQLLTKKEKESAGRPTYLVLYQDNIFLGVISYSKNLIGHYNDHHPRVCIIIFLCDLKIFMGFVWFDLIF